MYIKHKRLLAWAQLLILLSIPVLNATAQAKVDRDTLVNIYVDNYPPYTDEHNDRGAITNLVVKAFATQGLTAVITYKPWQAVETAIDGENKLSFMWSKTAEHKRKWIYSNPVYTNRQVLVIKKGGGVNWHRLDELRHFSLGITQHHNYGSSFENYREYLDLSYSVSDYLSLKKLINGEVQASVMEQLKAKFLLSYLPTKQRKQLEILEHKAIDTSDSYLVCSRQYAKCSNLVQVFNRGLITLKQNSQYQQIITKVFE